MESMRWFCVALCILCLPLEVGALEVVLTADLDATLIEDPNGALANGAGPALFAGRTSQGEGSRRRALVYFDVAGSLPASASIESVELVLELTPSNTPVVEVTAHRVLTPWSEGSAASSGGGGAPATEDDVTWLHTSYDTERWRVEGGDFDDVASASATVSEPGTYVWGSTPSLASDVQSWLDEPASNNGWLLLGDEGLPSTSKRFSSREDPDEAVRPRLTVVYTIPCEAAGLARGALRLCRAYCEALDCAGPEPRGSERSCSRLARNFDRMANGALLPCEAGP